MREVQDHLDLSRKELATQRVIIDECLKLVIVIIGHTQARISSLLAFLTDLWKLKEEAIAKQGKAEVGVVVVGKDDNQDGIDDDGDEKYHRRWEMEEFF